MAVSVFKRGLCGRSVGSILTSKGGGGDMCGPEVIGAICW